MREVQIGVWCWEAPHPDWKPGEEWDEMVSSYAIDDGDRLLLFDPQALPSEWANKGVPPEQILEGLRAVRAAGRARAPDARGAHRPSRARARAFLTSVVPA